MLKKRHFVAVNSCISGEASVRFQSKTCTIPLDNYSSIKNWLCFVEYYTVAVSNITKCVKVTGYSSLVQDSTAHAHGRLSMDFERTRLVQSSVYFLNQK